MTYWKPPRDPAREEAQVRRQAEEQRKATQKVLDEQQRRHERELAAVRSQTMREHARNHFEEQSRYTNLVLLLGYGGYFTLWLEARPLMSLWLFGWTGTMLASSIAAYVLWELARIYTTEVRDRKSIPDYNRGIDRLNKYQPAAFIVTAGAGVLGGLPLLGWFVYTTIRAAAALPVVLPGPGA